MGSTGPNLQCRGLDANHQPSEMVGVFAFCPRDQFVAFSCPLGGDLSKFWEKFDSGYLVELFKFGILPLLPELHGRCRLRDRPRFKAQERSWRMGEFHSFCRHRCDLGPYLCDAAFYHSYLFS